MYVHVKTAHYDMLIRLGRMQVMNFNYIKTQSCLETILERVIQEDFQVFHINRG